MKSPRTTVLGLALSLISCGVISQNSDLLNSVAPAKSSLVRFQNSFRSTTTYVNIHKADIQRFFDTGARVGGFDFSAVAEPIMGLLTDYGFESVVLDAQKDRPLLTLNFDQAKSYQQSDGKILHVAKSVSITSIGETENENLMFHLAGFTYGDQNTNSLEWNEDEGAKLHLADSTNTEFDIEPFIDFYDDQEDLIIALVEMFEGKSPSAGEILEGSLSVSQWFKKTDVKNRIHVTFNANSEWHKSLSEKISETMQPDPLIDRVFPNLVQFYINTKKVTIDLKKTAIFTRYGKQIKLHKRFMITSTSGKTMRFTNVDSSEPKRRRWFKVVSGAVNGEKLKLSVAVPKILGPGYRYIEEVINLPNLKIK
jgi:hypothetical protein